MEAEFLTGAFGTWWKKLPKCWCAFATVYLIPSCFCHYPVSKKKAAAITNTVNQTRRTNTDEIEAAGQLTRAQVEYNYARSACEEQGIPLPRSGERKVLQWVGCNAIFISRSFWKYFPNTVWRLAKVFPPTHVYVRRNVPPCQEKRRCIVLGTMFLRLLITKILWFQ